LESTYKNRKTGERAVDSPGWLIGCIAPATRGRNIMAQRILTCHEDDTRIADSYYASLRNRQRNQAGGQAREGLNSSRESAMMGLR
jgi:hypothetical protein